MTEVTRATIPADLLKLFREIPYKKACEMADRLTEVKPGLYLTGEDVTDDEFLFKERKIQHILNAAPARVPSHFKGKGITYLEKDLVDEENVDIYKEFKETCAWLRERREKKETVMVHCYAGISRSVTLVTAHLMEYDKLSLQAALALIIDLRPIARPNNGFLRQLMRFEAELDLVK
ncbi:Dual specificity protein phosphatase [uncultured virus]|nr:Dual specificity protein phosphatase [uncultured virus]